MRTLLGELILLCLTAISLLYGELIPASILFGSFVISDTIIQSHNMHMRQIKDQK